MKKYHYDNYYYKNILKLSNKNFLEKAIEDYKCYIEFYPYDLSGYTFLADALIKIGNFEEAQFFLNQGKYFFNYKNSKIAKESFIWINLKMLCCQNKFNEAYILLQENINIFENFNPCITNIFLMKKLGILPNNFSGKSYLATQIINYDENMAIEHIKKHQYGSDNPLQFSKDFLIKKTFIEIRNIISTEQAIYNSAVTNIYKFKYIANGHVYYSLVDYIEVVTLHNSNEIITMYPYQNKEKKIYTDITPNFEDSLKLVRINQIDKFYKKYQNLKK